MEGERVGELVLKDNGNLQFRYHDSYSGPAISRALPKQREAHPHAAVRAVFGGLLPEGDVRETVARNLGVSASNDYALLAALGGDVAGALTLLEEGQQPSMEPTSLALGADDVERLLMDLPQRPLAADPEEGIRLSLAGAQTKVPIIIDERVTIAFVGGLRELFLDPCYIGRMRRRCPAGRRGCIWGTAPGGEAVVGRMAVGVARELWPRVLARREYGARGHRAVHALGGVLAAGCCRSWVSGWGWWSRADIVAGTSRPCSVQSPRARQQLPSPGWLVLRAYGRRAVAKTTSRSEAAATSAGSPWRTSRRRRSCRLSFSRLSLDPPVGS